MKYMKRIKKIKLLTLLMVCLVVMSSLYGCGNTEGEIISEETVELYFFSACESCTEGEKFENEIRNSIKEDSMANITIKKYNVFLEKDREFMEKRASDLGLTINRDELPVAIVNGKVYSGTYEEIGSKLSKDIGSSDDFSESEKSDKSDKGETYINEETKEYKELKEIDETDSILILFTTYSCDSCKEAKECLETINNQKLEVQTKDGSVLSNVKIIEKNILEEDNLDLLDRFIKLHDIPTKDQQVPILSYDKGYLSGVEDIKNNTEEVIKEGKALGFDYENFMLTGEDEPNSKEETSKIVMAIQLLVTGFLNGLNPCSISMLLMVLSILVMADGKTYNRGSFLFILAKFVTYIGMGLGIFQLFFVIKETRLAKIETVLTYTFAILALIFAIMNLMDYINVKREEYGKVVSQLPSKLRQWNHNMIKKLKNTPEALFLPALFILGVIISVGEFFCTGQLYVASVYNLSRQEGAISITVALQLILYVMAMSLPQVILVLVIGKSKDLFSTSRLALEGMPVVKLIYAGLFFFIFIFMLFF